MKTQYTGARAASAKKATIFLPLLVLSVMLLFTVVSCGTNGKNDSVSPSDASVPSEPPAEVSLSDLTLEIGKGITRELTATGGSHIVWTTSDASVADVTPDGSLTGVNLGECTLTAENEFGKTAECHVTVKKTCYLTVDDGPLLYTAAILRKFKKHDVKATFFVVNTYNIASIQQMHEEGHLIGMHAYDHTYSVCYRSQYGYFADLEKLADIVEGYVGYRPNIIRFPGGTPNHVCDPLNMRRIVNGANDLGYRVFDWTSSTGDATPDLEVTPALACYMGLGRCTHDVDILLMHDTEVTPAALDKIIPALKERGYVFETLDHYPETSMMDPCWYSTFREDVPCESLALKDDACVVEVDGTFTLEAIMTPKQSTDYVRWECDDPSVAKVAPDGVVTGLKPGTATITAITTGGQRAVCQVTVE